MQKKQSGLRGWIRTIADLAVIVLIVLAAKTAIAEPFYVPSGSMEPTLLIGDELLAMKFPYGYSSAS
ncbi:MAG: S26 family signal peptidase, partial [Pseudolabrys sp.]